MYPKKKSTKPSSDTFYQPLKGYKSALESLKGELSQKEFAECQAAMKIYSSCSTIDKLSKKENTKVFPALFQIGDTLVQEGNPKGFQWWIHAVIIGEKMEPNIEFAEHYLEMADIFQMNGVEEQVMVCVERGLKIINQVQGTLENNQKYVKGRLLHLKGRIQEEIQYRADPLQKASLAQEAIKTLSQSAAVLESIGPDFEYNEQNLVQVYEMLFSVLVAMKSYPQGIPYAKKCLDLTDKVFGLNNERSFPIALNLAKTLAEEKRFDEAILHAKKYEDITVKGYGPGTPMLANCYHLYALIGSRSGDYANALANFEKAEKLAEKTPIATPERFGERFLFKTRCQFDLGNFKEAKECFDEALKYNKTLGDNKKMADCYYAGAEILKGSKLFIAETKDNYLKALAIYRDLYDVETVEATTNFGAFLHENGEYPETIKLLLEAKEICQKWLPQRKDLLESCHNVLGMAQVFAGQAQDGIPNLEEAIKICEETGNETGRLTSHYFNLVKAYSMNNQLLKAMAYGKKIVEKELATNGKDSKWIHATTDLLATGLTQMNPLQLFEELDKNA